MSEIDAYREWLASGHTDRAVIETVEISHPSFPTAYLAKWPESINCKIETGETKQFQAANFEIEPASINDTTNQNTQARISALDGAIYDLLKSMTYVQRIAPIELIHRLYFNTDFNTLIFTPPARWVVHSVTVGFDSVVADLRTEPLRSVRIGRYFTKREFPVLVYL
jgi:hypothetical protein